MVGVSRHGLVPAGLGGLFRGELTKRCIEIKANRRKAYGGPPMSKIDDLLAVPGVFAVGEFDDQGDVVAFRAREGLVLPDHVAGLTAQYCNTMDGNFQVLAEAFTQQTQMEWTPKIGWMFAGGEYAVAVSNGFGAFSKTFETDFNDLFNALVGAR